MTNQIAFCVTGWHYPIDFYTKIKNIPGVDLFILSHKAKSDLPGFILETILPQNILIKPNLGYDWGCFQQFLETGYWKSYDYIFFMHDDIDIIRTDFIDACLELLKNGASIVGNGRPFDKRDWPRTNIGYYAHSGWKPASLNFEHDIVRGSFFVTTREALEKVGSFEVFWDKFHLAIGFGNYSLLASCGKIASVLGEKAYAYLSNEYLSSPYISEFERGNMQLIEKSAIRNYSHQLFNWFFMSWFSRLCKTYSLSVMEQKLPSSETFKEKAMRTIIQIFAGR